MLDLIEKHWEDWLVYRTTLEMLCDRGYILTEEELNSTEELFIIRFLDRDYNRIQKKNMTIFAFRDNNNNNKENIMIFFSNSMKLEIEEFKTYYHKMLENECNHCILIYPGKITKYVMESINAIKEKKNMYVELFENKWLTYNVSRHEDTPKHILLSEQEKEKLIEEYDPVGKGRNFPKLLITDRVAQYYGFTKGQMIKILRKHEKDGREIYYRIVT